MEEVWKDVVGYEGLYEISSHGRLRSITRYVKNGTGERVTHGKLISQKSNGTGYFFYHLCDAARDKSRAFYVHTLVARAFIGEKPDKYDVDHIDTDKGNNYADNLRYISKKENSKRRYKKPGWDTTVLTREQVRWIRHAYGTNDKMTYQKLAAFYNVSSRCIQKACKRETWRNVI